MRSPPKGGTATADEVLGLTSAPAVLTRLLRACEGAEREDTWAEFVAAHSDVLLHICRAHARNHDVAMDGYAYVLEALREDGCRRLHGYVPDGETRFTTWLVVVARRLLLDHYRRRYGRSRSKDESRRADSDLRRRLEDLVAAEVDTDQLSSAPGSSPDASIRRAEMADLLRLAIKELAPPDRLLLALRFEDERPVREIARILRLPTVFHVYRRQALVLAALRRTLARRGVEGPEP